MHKKEAALASFNVRVASFCYKFILLVFTTCRYYSLHMLYYSSHMFVLWFHHNALLALHRVLFSSCEMFLSKLHILY